MSTRKIAFTLIELLVVIAIIGILSGLIVVSMNGVSDKATIAKAQVFSNPLKNSLMLNLVSEWKFDEINVPAANQTPDSWSGGNSGTLAGPTHLPVLKSSSNCVFGSCLQFDGTEDYVDFGAGSNLNLQGAMTIDFWVNPLIYDFGDVATLIFGNGTSSVNGYLIWLWKTGYVQYRTNQSSAQQNTSTSTGYIPNNVWTYIAITRSGTTATIYINGVDRTSSHGSHIDPVSSSTDAFSSKYPPGASYYLKGLLDNIRVYGAVIPTSQIKEQYYSGLNNLLASGQITNEEYLVRIDNISSK